MIEQITKEEINEKIETAFGEDIRYLYHTDAIIEMVLEAVNERLAEIKELLLPGHDQ